MARQKPVDKRVQAFVAAMLAERPVDDHEQIDDIERDMEALADAVADEFATQLLRRPAASPPSVATCPDCGAAGQHLGVRQREITTTRGSVPLVEPKHYCPACRRHFFPAVGGVGPLA